MTSPLPFGTKLGRYEIRSKIGAGGMGDVYLARDRGINRDVALKVLPTNFSSDRERLQRFKLEAQAAASLNHPYIAHIYEVNEIDNTHFIAMEFVDGQSLRDFIHSNEADLSKLLRYMQQAAEGLAKAHAAGIVHRDLKPENIMISRDGYAKILDFGLAKLIEPQKSWTSSGSEVATVLEHLSRSGVILGTVGYMSPEQAQGRTAEIDQRSDIFSFGCILCEAVTGSKPFQGEDTIDSLNKIIREPAPSISLLRPELPLALEKIVRRCLEKDPGERYQSIKDVANDLKELRTDLASSGTHISAPGSQEHSIATYSGALAGAPQTVGGGTTAPQGHPTRASGAEYLASEVKRNTKTNIIIAGLALIAIAAGVFALRAYLRKSNPEVAIDSIAVLPFINQNNDPETEYRSDGLTESIINSLAQLPNLRVIARSSVFRYKGKEADPLAAGRELGVRAVLTGRILQRGDNLTISTELIDVRENKQLWGEQYSQNVSDLLSMQRAIAGQITSNLRLKLTAPDQSRLAKHYTDSPEAYQAYLKGRFHWNKRTAESLEKSVEYLNQAIEKDPSYALAYAGLADTWFSRGWYRYLVPREAYERARAAATKALEIDDHLAEGHAIMAAIKTTYEWDWPGAEREFKLAIELNPNYATAHQRYSLYLPITGRLDEAIAEARKARELDPLSLPINENVGDILYLARRYAEAIDQLRKTLDLDPNYGVARGTLAKVYEAQGQYDQALQERLHNAPPETAAQLKTLFSESGIRGVWQHRLDQLLERSKTEYVSPADIALFYARLNQKDQAFAWLEKAMEERSILFNYLIADARFDNLRPDPRFGQLVRRVGLQPLS
jgi:TolB-like protein/Tfp pilus assembly protein PilF/predicted Ser/Thr protein kinase